MTAISRTHWSTDPASAYHFREWPDAVVLYMEGEGGTYLLNPFAAELIKLINQSSLSAETIVNHFHAEYPGEPLSALENLVDTTLNEFHSKGIVSRIDA